MTSADRLRPTYITYDTSYKLYLCESRLTGEGGEDLVFAWRRRRGFRPAVPSSPSRSQPLPHCIHDGDRDDRKRRDFRSPAAVGRSGVVVVVVVEYTALTAGRTPAYTGRDSLVGSSSHRNSVAVPCLYCTREPHETRNFYCHPFKRLEIGTGKRVSFSSFGLFR